MVSICFNSPDSIQSQSPPPHRFQAWRARNCYGPADQILIGDSGCNPLTQFAAGCHKMPRRLRFPAPSLKPKAFIAQCPNVSDYDLQHEPSIQGRAWVLSPYKDWVGARPHMNPLHHVQSLSLISHCELMAFIRNYNINI